MPVSSTAIFANGILALFAAVAAALKILSTCSCEKVAYFCCAFLTLFINSSSCFGVSTTFFVLAFAAI